MWRELQRELGALGKAEDVSALQRFFKTGPGKYGEGDRFRGIKMPAIRQLVRRYKELSEEEIEDLLRSHYHEDRMLGVLLWVHRFERGDEETRAFLYERYLAFTERINGWDLVDLSAPHIVGVFLLDRDHAPLFELARSSSLWERRIAMLASFTMIRALRFETPLVLAKMLLHDEHDLMHKAVGWMLREIGKRDLGVMEGFLKKHYKKMPRTMLRYAIEKLEESRRQAYLKGTV
ncbi:MAG: DNA alkylation repair protein [Myxococcales bacterium]|nr:DNA alkylation repair protein [Myxococcales bacterium]